MVICRYFVESFPPIDSQEFVIARGTNTAAEAGLQSEHRLRTSAEGIGHEMFFELVRVCIQSPDIES